MTFLDYYKSNLVHIRHLGAEFAAEFPKIAARLDLGSIDCADPYVERLLEGTAFLAARVENKMESGYPRLLEALLSSIAPAVLNVQPSYCVFEIQQKNQSCSFPAWTRFQTLIPGIRTPCSYSTMQDFKYTPISIASLDYSVRDFPQFTFTGKGGLSAAVMQFNPVHEKTDSIDFYIDTSDGTASKIIELFTVCLHGVFTVKSDGTPVDLTSEIKMSLPMFERRTSGAGKLVTAGLTDLQQFLACPDIFKFLRISGLSRYFSHGKEEKQPLYFVFSKKENSLLHVLSAEIFKTGCFPAVNLFKKDADRIQVNGQYEYQVIPDRTATLDYEVYQVLSAEVFDDSNRTMFKCRNIYDMSYDDAIDEKQGYFVAHRQEKLVPEKRLARSSYTGSEVFISFTGKAWTDNQDSIAQVQPVLLCTNRELPLLLPRNAVFTSAKAEKITALQVTTPTRPDFPLVRRGKKTDWETVSYISFNLSSLLFQEENVPIHTLGALIRAYSSRSEEETGQIVDGLSALTALPGKFRFTEKGCVFFESGWNVTLTLLEKSYEGIGLLLFALALKNLMRNYMPLNSCMRLTIQSDQRGDVVSWEL